jgi:thiol-disulfide isomerase/thioredoxin
MMRSLTVPILVALSLAGTLVALAEADPMGELSIGDPAPPLAGGRWLRGRVDRLQKGRVYLLDFWATWCAPCLAMTPAHQSLQDRLFEQGLRVIGVAIWSGKGPLTPAESLTRHPDLTYPVVEDVDGNLARTYMDATDSGGLPTVMVVDRAGTLVWVGEPGPELEDLLKAVLEGSFDLQAAGRQDLVRRRSQTMFAEIDEQRRSGRSLEAAAMVDAVIALDEGRNGWAYAMKYEILAVDTQELAAAATVAEEFLASASSRNPFFNYAFAYRLINSRELAEAEQIDLDLALRLATRAVDLAPEPAADHLALLARVHDLRGERSQAVRRQKEAAGAATGAERKALEETLADYLKSGESPR